MMGYVKGTMGQGNETLHEVCYRLTEHFRTRKICCPGSLGTWLCAPWITLNFRIWSKFRSRLPRVSQNEHLYIIFNITSKELLECWGSSGVVFGRIPRKGLRKDFGLSARISWMQHPRVFPGCWKTNQVSFHARGRGEVWAPSLQNQSCESRTRVVNLGLHELLCNAERRLAGWDWEERKTPWDVPWMCDTAPGTSPKPALLCVSTYNLAWFIFPIVIQI